MFTEIFRRLGAAVVVVVLMSNLSCISNPFGGGEISGGNRNISGRVQLSDNFDPEGVYVWLEGLDAGVRTDDDGNFQLTLPSPASQPNGGLSGIFDLFFYLENFNLVSKQVSVNRGEFVYSQSEMNRDGKFHTPIFLLQSLSIEILMTPNTIESDSGGRVAARVFLRATRDSVRVFFPFSAGNILAPLFFHNLDTDEIFIHECVLAGIEVSEHLTIKTERYERIFVDAIGRRDLPVGKYEVIPYLFLEDKQIPPALLRNLGYDAQSLATYLKIPFKRQGGQFQVN